MKALEPRPSGRFDQWVDAMQQHPGLILQITEKLTTSQVHQLIKALLTDSSPDSDRRTAVFMEAVEMHAARTASKARYYAEIIQHIVKGHPIDFEQISKNTWSDPAPDMPIVSSVPGKSSESERKMQRPERHTPAELHLEAEERLIPFQDGSLSRKLKQMQTRHYSQIQA